MSENIASILKNKEILVTGGCGFIGSEITKQLSNLDANVTVLDNLSSGKEDYIQNLSNVELIVGDITDEETVNKSVKDKDYVLHLAALPFIPDSYYYPMKFFDVNVNSTITLALAANKQKSLKRFVHISSSEIYGSSRYSPMNENHPTIPQSTYAVSKLAGERVIFTIHKEHNLPAVIIRPFNAFGPNITQPYIIPEIISQLLSGKNEVTLGNINSRRDLTFVEDTAKAMIKALVVEGVNGETLNVGSERSIAIKDLVYMISSILSKEVNIKIDPSRFRPHDVDTLVCDYSRATRLLDWKPEISIMKGLELTVNWAQKHKTKFKDPFKGWTFTYKNNQKV